MSGNGQPRASEHAINTPGGSYYPNQASSQLPGYNIDPSINAPNLPVLGTFYPHESPEEGFEVAMFKPTIHQAPPAAPAVVHYAPPPGVQYAPAFPGTPKMTARDAPQNIPPRDPPARTSIFFGKLPPPVPESLGSLSNTAVVTTTAARLKRAQSPGNKGEDPFKKAKIIYSDEVAPRRLRIGNLDARVTKGEIQGLFRYYDIDSVDVFHDDGGVFALVVLSSTPDVREAIYQLWNKKLRGRRITIKPDSNSEVGREAQRDLEPTRVLWSQMEKRSAQPAPKPTSISSPFKVPPHLFHRPRPDANTVARDNDFHPELKAIAENRRMYIRDLPFGTTEEILRDLLKERSIENLTIPYDPRTRLYTGYFAFVDFTTPIEVQKALKLVFHYNLAGNKIQGSTKPVPPMLREPNPCTHEVSGAKGRLTITNLANGASEDDLRTFFEGLSTTTVVIQTYANSERPTGCAFVVFDEVIDSHRAAIRLSGRGKTTLGCKIEGEASSDYVGLNRDEHWRCGIDPSLPGGAEYGRDGKNPRLRPKAEPAEPASLPKKPGDAMQLAPVPHQPVPSIQPSAPRWPKYAMHSDAVPHRPAPSIHPPALWWPRDFMQLDPVPHQPPPREQPFLRKRQKVTPKIDTQQRRTATVLQPPLSKVQGGALEEDQEASIFNRTALRDWFWEHKGLSLDI